MTFLPPTPITLSGPGWAIYGNAEGAIPDADGNEWHVEYVDGWDNPIVRGDTVDRPFADGAYVSDRYLGSRPMTIKGSVVSSTGFGGVLAAQARLTTCLNGLLRADGLLTVGGPVTKQAAIRRGPALRTDLAANALTFEVEVEAADPHKYQAGAAEGLVLGLPTDPEGLVFPVVAPIEFGTLAGEGGFGVALNVGGVDTWPTVVFYGPVDSPSLELFDTGETFALDLTIADGEAVTVNMAERTILLGGTASRRSSMVPGSTWFPFTPGSNSLRFRAAAYAAGTAHISWRNAWL